MVYALIAIVIVLLAFWIWMNALYIRKHNPAQSTAVATPDSPQVAAAVEPDAAVEPEVDGLQASSRVVHEATVEVTPRQKPSSERGVFANRDRPYIVHDVNVSLFADVQWQTAFKQLTEDERVLGWVAFHEGRIGASDRVYDQDFLEAVRQHRRATEKLRRHVGLSNVTETTVIGDEGKVWFLTVMADAWFALFIDKDVDGGRLASELLQPVRDISLTQSAPDA